MNWRHLDKSDPLPAVCERIESDRGDPSVSERAV